MKFCKCLLGWTALLSLFLLAGYTISSVTPAERVPGTDGLYDNHPYLVDSSRMDLARIMASFVTLHTRTKFEALDGEVMEYQKSGSGLILDGRFVLTVEHVVSQHQYSVVTPLGVFQVPVKRKILEETSFCWNGKRYPLRSVYKNRDEDVALLEISSKVRLPSFPYQIGDSDDLQVGNFVYVVGNPLSVGVNVREGIVSAMRAPPEVSAAGVNPVHGFMVSNGLMPGDSGSPIIAIRDGRFELVGISQGTVTGNTRLSWGIRINVIRKLLEAAHALPSEKWAKRRHMAVDENPEDGSGFAPSPGVKVIASRLIGALFPSILNSLGPASMAK